MKVGGRGRIGGGCQKDTNRHQSGNMKDGIKIHSTRQWVRRFSLSIAVVFLALSVIGRLSLF